MIKRKTIIYEEAWKEENREAIQERNAHVEKHGIFGEEYRAF